MAELPKDETLACSVFFSLYIKKKRGDALNSVQKIIGESICDVNVDLDGK